MTLLLRAALSIMFAILTTPLVLLWLGDDALAHAVHAMMLDHMPHTVVVRCAAAGEVVDVCATQAVALVIVSARVDDTAGLTLLRQLGAFGAMPQTMVLFEDVNDRRRAGLARAGALEHVLARSVDAYDAAATSFELAPLSALVDRVIVRGALQARLDHASQQFKTLVDNSNDGIYLLRDGRFLYTNRRFQHMVGFSAEELLQDDFVINARLVGPQSRQFLLERQRLQQLGVAVPARYEFVAQKKTGEVFDAQVSVSSIDVQGPGLSSLAGALGIMQDITERKRFETQLVRKNRELALINDLAHSISHAVALDDTLAQGCRRLGQILGAAATGVSLIGADPRTLSLRFSDGLNDELARAMGALPLDGDSLLALAVRSRGITLVDDVKTDNRVAIGLVKASRFAGCIVVPLIAGMTVSGAARRILGVAFAFLDERAPRADDTELMVSIGALMGNAVIKAGLLEREQRAVEMLVALDEIAVALASTLDINEVARTVARNVHRLFGATRVLIASLQERSFVALHVLDDGEPSASPPIPYDETIMGLCLDERTSVQRVRSPGGGASIDPLTQTPVELLPYEADLFEEGIGAGVAIPVLQDGEPVGALWVGYSAPEPLTKQALDVLTSIGAHVAIAMKNARLFAARNLALHELQAAQDKLVQAEKLNAIGLIAHGVAHDFNNVLGSILGRAQLLKSQLHDPQLLKHVDVIEQAADDGAETVRRIQEIGRRDQIDDFVAVDLNELMQDVVDLTQAKWQNGTHPIDVRVVAAPQPAMVAANPHQLREVLINLVHNAVDAMPSGGLLELLTTSTTDAWELRVTDTGSGIPPSVLQKIFDPYFTTKGARGTGLGLSVSDSIMRRHGASLSVTSHTSGEQRGTQFVLAFSRHRGPAPSVTARVDVTRTQRARVLVVDDEANIREILCEILLSGGHEPVAAADGAEALHLLRSAPFDIVFTDLGLPGMSGYEVASACKKLRPDVPIGLITGWGASLDLDVTRAHGVDMVISKPFRFEQVLGLVDEAMLTKRRAS